jgi:hypothetical protein
MPRTAAGSAVGADAPGVAVPPERAEEPGRRCGAWTAARDAVAAWRRQGQRAPVGLASTGVSGLARCAGRAARGCAGKLGAAQHARHGPGRKTAVRDGPWRPALPPAGCRQGAWRPAAEGCGRRRSRRHRRRLVARAWRAGPQRQQAREQRPLPWTEVVSARHGKPGRARSPALLAGARAPPRLASPRARRGPPAQAPLAKAWAGPWRAAPLVAVPPALEPSAFLPQQWRAWETPSDGCRQPFVPHGEGEPPPPPPARTRRSRQRQAPRWEVHGYLRARPGVALRQREGREALTALKGSRESGLALTRWPTGQPWASWVGGCPGHKGLGGKRERLRSQPTAQRAASA